MFKAKLIVLFFYLAFSTGVAYGRIELPPLLSDGMVLQQRSGVTLWGSAGLNTDVWVSTSWDNRKYKTTSGAAGKWKLIVKTPKAGGPYHITISDGEEIRLSNVLIGEVWLCSGQSNMEMTFKGYGANEPVFNQPGTESKNSMIRLFTVKRATGGSPKEHAEGVWNESSPESIRNFSAVAYQFGKILYDSLKVPIGLISSSWGGSRIEFWMSANSLKPFPEVKILAGIDTMKVPEKAPTALYNGMIAPLVNYAIRGVIWYQGESNRDKPVLYAELLPAMVSEWRRRWQKKDMPFYYVQIAPFAYPNDKERLLGAVMREAQLKAQKDIPHSGMAVIMDAGSELKIHPPDKRTVSTRLAYHALAKTYKKKGIASESPSYLSMKPNGEKIIIRFDHAVSGLESSGDRLLNFEIAGTDKVFYPATARILPGGRIEVWNEAVTSPVAVRYAFKNWAVGDLYNHEGLPASSFRTDSWEIRKHLPPGWISETPIVFIGNWDAMPIFRRRVGGNPVWQEDEYLNEHTEEAVKKLREMGVTMALIHFYKGFGLDAEKEHMEMAKKLATLCKENGIKVGVYIGSTVAYETFLLEKPEAAEWFVPDYLVSCHT